MKRYKKSYKTVRKKSIFDVFKIFKYKASWIVLLSLIILGSLVYLFIFSSVFQVKNIEVSQTEKSLQEEIRNIISENSDNIFLSDIKGIVNKILDRFPQISSVSIKRKLPDRLIAQINERVPVAVFCRSSLSSSLKIFGIRNGRECFFIDNQGIVFEEASGELTLPIIKVKNSIYRFILGQEAINKEYLEKLLSINNGLKDIEINQINPVSKDRIDIKTSDGWDIYFNIREDIGWQIEKLNILLKEKLPPEERGSLEYIDLRFDKVYIYPSLF